MLFLYMCFINIFKAHVNLTYLFSYLIFEIFISLKNLRLEPKQQERQ